MAIAATLPGTTHEGLNAISGVLAHGAPPADVVAHRSGWTGAARTNHPNGTWMAALIWVRTSYSDGRRHRLASWDLGFGCGLPSDGWLLAQPPARPCESGTSQLGKPSGPHLRRLLRRQREVLPPEERVQARLR